MDFTSISQSIRETPIMLIKFKTINAGAYELNVESDIVVTELKERLAPVASVAPDRQRLIFRGKVLTDASRVSDFSIEDGDTVHLIIRKDDAPPTAAAPPAAEVPAPANAPVNAPIDLNSIMNNVMNSLGIAGNSGNVSVNVTTGTVGPDGRIHVHNAPAMPAMSMGAPMGHMGPQALPLPAAPMMPCDNVRETLNQVNTDLAAVLHANSLPCDSAQALAGPIGTDVAGIVAVAQQTLTSTARIQTSLQFLMSRMGEEPNMTVPAQRAALEELNIAVGTQMRRLGAMYGQVGRRLCMLQSGSAPGQLVMNADAPAAAPQVLPGAPGGVMMVNMEMPGMPNIAQMLSSMNSMMPNGMVPNGLVPNGVVPAPSPPSAQMPPAPTVEPPAPSPEPMPVVPVSEPEPIESSSPSDASPELPPRQMPDLSGLMGLLGGLGAPSGGSGAPNLGNLLGALGGSGQSAGSGAPNLGGLLGMLGGMGAPQGGQAPNLGSLMSSMMPMMQSMLGAQGMQMPESAVESAASAEESRGGLLERMMQVLMNELSMPEIMMLATSGDISSLERLQPSLRDMVVDALNDLDVDEDEEEDVWQTELADAWSLELASKLSVNPLPPNIVSQLNPGVDPSSFTDRSFDHLRPHLKLLISTLRRDEMVPTAAEPTPFVNFLRSWGVDCVGGWIDMLSECFRDGTVSVQELVRAAISQNFGSLLGSQFGFMAQMGSQMIGGLLQRVHTEYRQRRAAVSAADHNMLAQERWAQLLPPAVRSQWCETIAADQRLMADQDTQGDLSEAYVSGPSAKRRKVSPFAQVFECELRASVQEVCGSDSVADAIVGAVNAASLPEAFEQRKQSE